MKKPGKREVAGYEESAPPCGDDVLRDASIFAWMKRTPNTFSALKRLWGPQ